MGKKINPEYRARMTARKQLPICIACRGRSRYLLQYTHPDSGNLEYFHRNCYRVFYERHQARIARMTAEQEMKRQDNLSVKDFWNYPDLGTAKAIAGFTDDTEAMG